LGSADVAPRIVGVALEVVTASPAGFLRPRAQFLDPGPSDRLFVSITWGDSSSDAVPLPVGSQEAQSRHVYAGLGASRIDVQVFADDLGGSVTDFRVTCSSTFERTTQP
jgi:hypothetical protein